MTDGGVHGGRGERKRRRSGVEAARRGEYSSYGGKQRE